MELAAAQLSLAPIVKLAISKVISNAEKQYGFMRDYDKELRKFLRRMEMTTGVLHDAEHRKAACHPGVKVWLEELRVIVEEADVVVDEISYKALERKAVQKQKLKQVSHLFTSSSPLAFRRRMASKINKLNDALDDLNKRASGLGLQYMLVNKKDPEHEGGSVSQTDASLGDPSGVIGREEDVQEVVRLLIESSNDQLLGVVSIVGVGGLGKTTMAKLVCNNEKIKRHFEKIIWVCVSESFDVFNILVEMMQSVTKSGSMGITNQNTVVDKIKDELKEKNYLLILDDVWNEDERKWENLRDCLLGVTESGRSSRVLVTTRLPKVASIMRSLNGRIEQLTDDDCWSIIEKQAFNNSAVPSELEDIGRRIAIKCRGVPLVATVVGGTLRSDWRKDHWLSVEKEFDAGGSVLDDDRVLHVLKSSFDRLPKSALKECFAYCSIFPKDFVMGMEMLIQLWMAQGFLQQPRGIHKEMEEIGEGYFMELVSYSFFQDVERDFYGRVVSCKVHDLMHDLAKSVSKCETLVLDDSERGDIPDIRHLNLICTPSMRPSKTIGVVQELHSLLSKVDVPCEMPIQFKRLLVLSFRDAVVYQLPGFLGKLKRLRYLDISGTKLKNFPKFISKLYQLQTFRYMDCYFLRSPLEGIKNLSNLKHICFDDGKLMPTGIGSLTCLQTLSMFVVGSKQGCRIEELEHLSQLKGDLRISELGNVRNKAKALRAKLSEKSAIVQLGLQFYSKKEKDGDHHEDVLEGLRPHSNLKGLNLKGYMGRSCPSWMLDSSGNLSESNCLRNLIKMQFHFCRNLKSIPSLSLSNLIEMEISFCEELETIPSFSFSNAAKLSIKGCKKLKYVVVTSLQCLETTDCGELVSIQSGALVITCLKEVKVVGCDKLESLPILGESPFLEKLHLSRCQNLICIGDSATSFASSRYLVELTLLGCPNLVSVPRFDNLSSLEELRVCHRQQLEKIEWESLFSSMCLKEFCLSSCDDLTHLPSLEGLSSLETFRITDCKQLQSIKGEILQSSMCLESVPIQDCAALMSISEDCFSLSLRDLKALEISNCPTLSSIPSLHQLSSLRKLTLVNCGLSRLPNELSSLLDITSLSLGGFTEVLEEFPDLSPIQHLNNSLKELCLFGWEKLKHLPNQIQYLTTLERLTIKDFGGLESIPYWFGNLSSLEHLYIINCNSLMHMPSMEAMRRLNLKSLHILSCPKFNLSCPSEWDKISHVQVIYKNHSCMSTTFSLNNFIIYMFLSFSFLMLLYLILLLVMMTNRKAYPRRRYHFSFGEAK